MKKLLYLLMVLAVLASAGFISTFQQGQPVQAQIGQLQKAVIEFDYPKMSVDAKDANYLKVNTGSMVYWFSTTGASDTIYDQDSKLVGNRKWRLSADTLTLDISGKVTYVKLSDYQYIVTRYLALPSIQGNVTITYDITGERTKATVRFATGNLIIKPIANLQLTWINRVTKALIEDDSLTETSARYELLGGKYIAFDWLDVKKSLGDIATANISSLSTTKEAEVVFVLGSLSAGKTITIDPTDEYSTAGTFTWTAPAGVTSVEVVVRGGGAGGANGAGFAPPFYGGSGGGGGAYSKKNAISVTPGGNYTVIVGAGGTTGGGAGGDSSFGNTSTILAKGGACPTGGASASGVGDTKYSGGNGGAGGEWLSGGGGGGAGNAGNGGNGPSGLPDIGGGVGGTSGGGAGGGTHDSGFAYAGTAPGGGGAGGWGGSVSSPGGAGAKGYVSITYYYAPSVATGTYGNITHNSGTLYGNITSEGSYTPDYYKFEWDTDSGSPYTYSYTSGAGSYGVGQYTRDISSLSTATEYFYRFGAHNTIGWTYGTEGKFLTLPLLPSSLHETAQTDTSITMAWNKGSGAQKTMLRYSDSAYPTTIGEGTQAYFDTGTSIEVTPLTIAKLYYFSAWSYVLIDGLSQYSVSYATDSAYTRPSVPTDLTASNPTEYTIDLDWTKGTGGDKTKIRVSSTTYPASITEGNPAYFDTGSGTTVMGLDPNTLYYFSGWAFDTDSGLYSTDYDTTTETTEIAAPSITNGSGATNVTETSATLNGEVTNTGGENPTCTFYWGDNDGGFDPGSWDFSHSVGAQSSAFSWDIGSLSVGLTYYYIVFGDNSGGSDWASTSSQFVTGCIEPGNITATLITDYRIDVTWEKIMPVTAIRAGLDNPPVDMFDGLSVYRGNGTSVSIYGAFSFMSGNLTLRAWADCTTCVACSTFKQSDIYSETYVMLTGNGTGGGSGDMTKAEYDTNDDGIVNEADYAALAGNSTYSITSGNSTYSITAGDADTLDTHHWSEIPSAGDMFKSTYDTNDDGVVDEADFAALAGDSDTLDGHHWVEIPGGGGNVTFVTDAGNVTGTLFYLLGSGTISTSGSGDTIIINGTTFLSLPDTPDSYVGQGGKYVAVNGNETAVVFVDTPPGGNVTSAFSHVSLPGGYLISASGEDTLYLQGTDIIFEAGDSGDSIEASIGGDNVDTLASNSTVALALGIPFLLGLIGAWRHSLTGYIAGILGLSIALGILQNDIGLSITIPVIVVILGLGLALVRDAWTQGVEIF